MAKGKKRHISLFWLKLIAIYILIIVLWPLVQPHYDLLLGRLTAFFVPPLAVEDTTVERIAVDDELRFFMKVRSEAQQKAYNLKYHLDPCPYGYGHILFTSLALAIPGWTLRRRLTRWIVGTMAIQVFFIFMVLLNLFSTVGSYNHPVWRGDLLTAIFPGDIFLQYRDFLSLVSAQFVPVLVWLGLFIFTGRESAFWTDPKAPKGEVRSK